MKDFAQWHKIVAILMHEFEINEFSVTEGMISALREECNGKLPTITYEETNGVFRVRLVPHEDARRMVQ